jgi:hypothetical protein
MVCSIEGCDNQAVARGWCPKHWMRWRHIGDAAAPTVQDLTPEERFWLKVDRTGSCWLWTAGKRGDGYGAFQVESRRQIGAHRYSYEIHHGPIPDDMVVMHACDVPLCVNPAHLSLGTVQENAADSARKARRHRGSYNSQSKLTEGQVLEMRDIYATGGASQPELARLFHVSPALVNAIINRKAWKHI